MALHNGGDTLTRPATYPAQARRDVRWTPSTQREVIAGFRAQAGRVAEVIVAEARRAVPAMAAALTGPAGGLLPSAVQAVILRGIDAVLAPRASGDDWTQMLRCVGALAYGAGCPADAVSAAYRAGEQAMCDQMRAYAAAHRVAPQTVAVLTAAVSRQVGTLCAVSIEGYETARESSSDTLAERRARLLRLLVDGHATDPHAIADEAHAARWPVPAAVHAIALRGPDTPAPVGRLAAEFLADLDGARPFLVVAAGVDRAALAHALPGWRIAVGPAVNLTQVRASLTMARKAIDLSLRNLITDGPVVDCAENGLALALFSDEFLIDCLVARRLSPLDDLTPRQRERMLVTLHEWLAMRGRAGDVADRLGVHPQTVRYRVHKIEELFSDQLGDPHARFELELAVRAELLRSAAVGEQAESRAS